MVAPKTIPIPNLSEPVVSHIIVTPLSDAGKVRIRNLQEQLDRRFPGLFWLPRREILHSTLLHIISPEPDYGGVDKDALFAAMQLDATNKLQELISRQAPITVRFTAIEAASKAIIIKGTDDGSFDWLRSAFTSQFSLPEPTTRPPNIIHSTVARYRKAHDLDEIQQAVAEMQLDVTELVTEFWLVRESQIFLEEFTVERRFALAS